MKTEIHPDYAETTISCACGHVYNIRSAGRDMQVNTCAACHPFFTGQAKYVDTEGRVDRFMKRYQKKG